MPSAYVKADKEEGLEMPLPIPQGMEIETKLLDKFGVQDKGYLAPRLKKGLYGLKQSGRLWNLMLHDMIMSQGFCKCYTDSCLYIKDDSDVKTPVGIYVDDVLVTATSLQEVEDFFHDMLVVELKNLGVVSEFLGILFHYDDYNGWILNQENVIDEMLERFGLAESAPVRVLIGGEDGDKEGALLPYDGKDSPNRTTADFPVASRQSVMGSLMHTSRHIICGAPSDSSLARAE